MDDWWNLSMPWWQFALRGAVAYAGLLVLLRLAGKRSFGELSPFDIVVLMLVGGALRSAIVGHDESVLGPFIAVATIVAFDRLLIQLCAVSPAANRIIEGEPVTIAKSGRVFERVLVRIGLPREGFDRELRHNAVKSVEQVDEARLEPNGRVTVLRRDA